MYSDMSEEFTPMECENAGIPCQDEGKKARRSRKE